MTVVPQAFPDFMPPRFEDRSGKRVVSTAAGRRTIQLPIDTGVLCLRGLSPERHRFELEYALERGSTANSVLFEAGDGAAAVLVHPPGAAYSSVFLPQLNTLLGDVEQPLLVVVGHVNPNRIALLRSLAEVYPKLELIASNPGAKLLEELWSQRKPAAPGEESEQPPLPPLPPLRVIRQEQSLALAHDRNLLLLPAPTPRWPGGLLAFEDTLGLLMSGKFFGAHLCTDTWAEANRSSTEEERRHFYDCLMAPMARQVDGIVERLEELDIRTLVPGHGPAIEASWRSLLNDYRRWGEGQNKASLNVALLFASAYGNTAAIADALAQGVNRTGIRVNSLNCEFTPADELVNTIKEADAILIGSPTLGGHAPTPNRVGTRNTLGRRRPQQACWSVWKLRLEWRGGRPAGNQAPRWRLQFWVRSHSGEIQPRHRESEGTGGNRNTVWTPTPQRSETRSTPQCGWAQRKPKRSSRSGPRTGVGIVVRLNDSKR
jgi:flavorubredoxin